MEQSGSHHYILLCDAQLRKWLIDAIDAGRPRVTRASTTAPERCDAVARARVGTTMVVG